MAVLRHAHRLRDRDAAHAWIHKVATHRVARVLRRERARPALEARARAEGHTHQPSPHELAEHQVDRQDLRRVLALLPEKQRLAIVLRHVHDLTHEQIADALGVRPGTASTLLSRAHATLRDALGPGGSDAGD